MMKRILILLALLISASQVLFAQAEARWLGVGSLHNFYMSNGMEREHALVASQQYGLRWPAIYAYQDMQAAKGLWIGTTNFSDAAGNVFPFKVMHIGPRATGLNEFFPVEHKLISRYDPVVVTVDDEESFDIPKEADVVDPSLVSNRMIYNKVNTAIGITMERRIYQWSNEYHDNYHIQDYTFTNTGMTDGSSTVTFPNKTLTGVMFLWQYRYSVVRQTRYIIGNATGWGINAMVDRFGDGKGPDYNASAGLRGHFTWHGRFPDFTQYDNIGGPIFTASTSAGFAPPSDTTGRLGAYHFVGNATLFAQQSVANVTDDLNQPVTMTEFDSDHALNSGNDQFNTTKMADEYNVFMNAGRTSRHAYNVEPLGDVGFKSPTGNPKLNSQGGWSAVSGYGPYSLAPGESIRIVVVEAASGISRELANTTGARFKRNQITALQKNEIVFQGRDSLIQTFERAKANFLANYNIPREPAPPTEFKVTSQGDKIFLQWDYDAAELARVDAFEIFRARGNVDSTYVKVADLPPTARDFSDDDDNPAGGPVRGLDYYYYVVARGKLADNPGTALTPLRPLRSSRYYTQSYAPARLLRPAGTSISQAVVVPNPFIRTASNSLTLGGRLQIAFYEIPGRCRIDIYTEVGEHVKTLMHTNGSGDEYWDLNTDARQRITSGIYIARVEDLDTGAVTNLKFVVVL